MRISQELKRSSLSISVVLSALFLLIMFACLVIVGSVTNGSLPATLLAIDWRTVVGFELVLLGSILMSVLLAEITILISKSLQYLFKRRRVIQDIENAKNSPSILHTRSFKFVCMLFTLPILTYLLLHSIDLLVQAEVAHSAEPLSTSTNTGQYQPINLGSTINSMFRDAEPSFTADGRTMYFNCNNSDICVSYLAGSWEAGNWSTPVPLGAPINTEYEEIEPVINGAGDQLYFTSIRPIGFLKNLPFLSPLVDVSRLVNIMVINTTGRAILGGFGMDDIYVSYKKDGVWTEPQNINDIPGEPHINTPFADHCLFFSADGNAAFWTSTMPGGYGSDDIWASYLVNGEWTSPTNLGPNVNGPGSEHSPIPTPDGRTLYITSDRPGGFGGEDIYISTRTAGGSWGSLANLGSTLNSVGDDRCAAWTPDNNIFLFDSVRNGGFGGRDIWWIDFSKVLGHPGS